MVVRHDDGGGAGAHSVAVDLADADRRTGQVSAVDGALRGHHVLGVEQQYPQLFALQGAHRIDEGLGDVGRRPDQPWVGRPRPRDPTSHLGARSNPQRGRLRQPRNLELERKRVRHPAQRAEPVKQPAGDPTGRDPLTDDECEHLLILGTVRAMSLEPLGGAARALASDRQGNRDGLVRHGERR